MPMRYCVLGFNSSDFILRMVIRVFYVAIGGCLVSGTCRCHIRWPYLNRKPLMVCCHKWHSLPQTELAISALTLHFLVTFSSLIIVIETSKPHLVIGNVCVPVSILVVSMIYRNIRCSSATDGRGLPVLFSRSMSFKGCHKFWYSHSQRKEYKYPYFCCSVA